jgi:hypothetical protein
LSAEAAFASLDEPLLALGAGHAVRQVTGVKSGQDLG